jgi:Ca2+-binding EF-hand superfamily protein
MWEKQLIRKIKTIILQQGITLDKFFDVIDKDGSGSIEGSELREGL